MRIWNGLGSYPDDAGPVAATIGNYDGVHLGHQSILRQVIDRAQPRQLRSLLITFDPHPAAVIHPERTPRLLQTRRQKLRSLQEAGLSDLLILRFDEALAALSGTEFFEQLLEHPVSFASIHVGEGFRFGHRRQGDLDLLRSIGSRRGFEVFGLPPVQLGERVISSSAIRSALEAGEVELAAAMLGRPYAIAGEVVHGEGRGHSLQCPTANLELENELTPRPGVYITETVALASRVPSVTNVGFRPTVGGKDLIVETHLLDFDEDLYEERVTVGFLARLRDEVRFDSLPELADQIARDKAAADSYFRNQPLG